MMIVTTETVPGETIEKILGLVVGASVRAAHLGTDVTVMMKNAVGGEMHEYTKILAEAREQALDRLKSQARTKGADAVIGLRFATSEICANAAEFLAYGTAVKLAKDIEK
jgi:uncharacterized protein YbjQ (UPF0145 family)